MWGANVSLDVLDAVRGKSCLCLTLLLTGHLVVQQPGRRYKQTSWAAGQKRLILMNLGLVRGQGQAVLPLADMCESPSPSLCSAWQRTKTSDACLGVQMCS